MVVMKFGGSSLANLERMENMARLVTELTDEPTAVVLSAMGDTTDLLLRAARIAEAGRGSDAADAVQSLVDAHRELVHQEESLAAIALLGEELEDVIHGISLLREQTPRTRALIASFGERLSVAVAAEIIGARAQSAVAVDARTMIETTGAYAGGRVQLEKTRLSRRALLGEFKPWLLALAGVLLPDLARDHELLNGPWTSTERSSTTIPGAAPPRTSPSC